MNEPMSTEDMIKEFENKKVLESDKKVIRQKKPKKTLCSSQISENIEKKVSNEEIGADYNYSTGKYHNQNTKRNIEKVEKANFALRSKLFLRLFTDVFLSFDIYNKFDGHFEILLVNPINEVNLNTNVKSFYTSIKAINLCGTTLPYKIILKDCEDLIRAEAYRYAINILQNTSSTLKTLNSLVRKFKPYSKQKTIFGVFSTTLNELLSDVINWKKDKEYIFNDISNEDDKLTVIKNTIQNFEQLDLMTLNQELVADFEITNEEFSDVFLGSEIGDILVGISEKAEENYVNLYQILKYDFMVENFQAFKKEDNDYALISDRSQITNISKLSLYHFSQGVIDGLTMLVLIEIFYKREKDSKDNKSKNIIHYLEKCKSKANVEFVEYLEYLVFNNKFKKITFLVYISRALCLTRREAFKLSEALGFGKETTFSEHYDYIYSNLFKNHFYIK
ncbi:MAG: hypothetical protein WC667_11695 [Sulfurimonas sp.]|jgi:hypothetical protein